MYSLGLPNTWVDSYWIDSIYHMLTVLTLLQYQLQLLWCREWWVLEGKNPLEIFITDTSQWIWNFIAKKNDQKTEINGEIELRHFFFFSENFCQVLICGLFLYSLWYPHFCCWTACWAFRRHTNNLLWWSQHKTMLWTWGFIGTLQKPGPFLFPC